MMKDKQISISFLLSSIDYAPFHKLIGAIKKIGVKTSILAFRRPDVLGIKYHQPFINLGNIESGHYLRRVIPLIRALYYVYRYARGSDVLYAINYDMALLAVLFKKLLSPNVKIIYEVHDIRDLLLAQNLLGIVIRKMESLILNNTDLLVLTSKAYLDEFYQKTYPIDNLPFYILENKLDKHILPKDITPQRDNPNPIVIGYFGSLRCNYSWNVLKALALKSNNRISIYIRGMPKGIKNFERDIESTPGFLYEGPYANPQDLKEIYGRIDLVWIAGFHRKLSYKWARSCRFYESCYFKRPMIAQKDTEEGAMVKALKIGFCVDINDVEGTIKGILEKDISDINRWQQSIERIPEEIYIYTNEHRELIGNIIQM